MKVKKVFLNEALLTTCEQEKLIDLRSKISSEMDPGLNREYRTEYGIYVSGLMRKYDRGSAFC